MIGRAKRRRTETGHTPVSTVSVGAEVEALCGKCKRTTTHIVLAKIGWKPTRVECRVCSAVHQFRVQSASRAGRDSRTAPVTMSAEELWTASMRQARGAPVPYSPVGRYSPGTRVNHARFGEGVVTRLPSTTVCEVVFASGTIKLLMGASASGVSPA